MSAAQGSPRVISTSASDLAHYPCRSCGGGMSFSSVTTMVCDYCGASNKIPAADQPAEAQWRNYSQAIGAPALGEAGALQPGFESALTCPSCGGVTGFSGTYLAARCPYCANPVGDVDVQEAPPGRVPVDAIFPFQLNEDRARRKVDEWIGNLGRTSFLPNGFEKYRELGAFTPMYLPYVQFEVPVATTFLGRPGERRLTYEAPKNSDRRNEYKTDWGPQVSGTIEHTVSAQLVAAQFTGEQKMPQPDEASWRGRDPQPFRGEFVAGIVCRPYEGELSDYYAAAEEEFQAQVEQAVRYQVGGDEQDLQGMESKYGDPGYRLVLYPYYLLTVRHRKKAWQVYVDGCSAEISGQEPKSKVKIAIAGGTVLFLVIGVPPLWDAIT